jgi:hypothetical protein
MHITLPWSLASTYERAATDAPRRITRPELVSDADLAALPSPVASYLRRVGVVGRPRVDSFRAVFRGEIRRTPDSDWMPFTAEQHTFIRPRTRLFFIRGKKFGVPFEALHAFQGDSATMRVRVASLFPIADARGPEMNQSETVTFLNDMCLLAPATLIDSRIRWESVDEHAAIATFTHGGISVSARLAFDDERDLVDFVSEDRYMSANGTHYERFPWSTPVGQYRNYHGYRLASHGDAIWKRPDGDLHYGKFDLVDVEYDLPAKAPAVN